MTWFRLLAVLLSSLLIGLNARRTNLQIEESLLQAQQTEFKEHVATTEWPCLDVGLPTITSVAARVRESLMSVVTGLRDSFQALLQSFGGAGQFWHASREAQQQMAGDLAQQLVAMFVNSGRGVVDPELLSGPNTVLVGLSASASHRFGRAVPHLGAKFRNASGVGLTLWFDTKTLSMVGEAEGFWNFGEAAPKTASSPWSFEAMVAAKLTTDSSIQGLKQKVACGPSFQLGYSIPTPHGALGMSLSLGLNENYQIEDISLGLSGGTSDGLTVALGYSAAQGLLVRELPRSYDEIVFDMLKNDPPLRLTFDPCDQDSFEECEKRRKALTTWDLMKGFWSGTTAG